MFFYAFIVFDITTVYVIYLDRMFNNILNRFFNYDMHCSVYHITMEFALSVFFWRQTAIYPLLTSGQME